MLIPLGNVKYFVSGENEKRLFPSCFRRADLEVCFLTAFTAGLKPCPTTDTRYDTLPFRCPALSADNRFQGFFFSASTSTMEPFSTLRTNSSCPASVSALKEILPVAPSKPDIAASAFLTALRPLPDFSAATRRTDVES